MKFLGSENIYSDYGKSRVVVIPVPYEKTTTYGKGAKNGPKAILDASDYVEHYDIEEDRVVSKIGISTALPLRNINSPKELFNKIKKITDKVLADKKIPVYLGGEHTISAAAVSAVKERYPGLTVLHMDAHSDMRDVYYGTKFSHACAMRRIFEMGVPVISVGIRSQCLAERRFVKEKGIGIFYAHNILRNKRWFRQAINRLGRNFYLTFDVDVMDPSCVRATGTPEPGGFVWQEVVDFFKAVSKSKKQLIGMDMVELSPLKGDNASDFLCAKLICKILALFVYPRTAR